MTPRVSVIVPCFNYAHTLGDALESVLAQTMPEWECVIVDDGSTDHTPRVAAEFAARDPRIRYVRQENRGLAAARNTGLRESTGPYIQLLDADDRLAADKLAVHAAYLDAHSGIDVVIGPATFFRTEAPDEVLYSLHGRLSRPMAPRVESSAEALRLLEHFNIMVAIAPLFRRGVVARIGGFNERLRACEDWDFWLRAALAGATFCFVDHDASLAYVRTHEGSMSRSSVAMMRGLIDAAATFEGPRLPNVYTMAGGLGSVVDDRRRLRGARQILTAARRATVTVSRVRWFVYGVAALILPRRLFWWLVTRPMPERGLELLRKLRRTPPASAR